jgi:deoxyadenosine/deoxycytidine kinase
VGNVIFVEGNIGCGKSTLARALGERFGYRVLDEPVDRELLELFYSDPKKYAFMFQMAMLHKRWRIQIQAACEEPGAIVDRSLWGDMVFAREHTDTGNIHPIEWRTYCSAVRNMCLVLFPPTLMLYLATDPETCLERVRKRNRPSEEGIDLDYLRRIDEGYNRLLEESKVAFFPWSHAVETMTVTADVTTVDDTHMDRMARTVMAALERRKLPDYMKPV